MEYVDGWTLKQLDSKYLSSDTILRILYEVLLGIQVLQSIGICHNDMNMSNVMLTKTGYVKLIDFGQAKLTSEKSLQAATGKSKRSNERALIGKLNLMALSQHASLLKRGPCQDALKFQKLALNLFGNFSIIS